MTIYQRKKTNYRRIWEQANNRKIPRDEQGRSYDIHHIDGDHSNNNVSNLKAVTIQEHYDIHYAQGDYGACLIMSKRMQLSPEEISELARKAVQKQLSDGTHPWLGGELQRKRVAEGSHNLLGEKNPSHKRIADGSHNFLGENNPVHKKVADGTHLFLGPNAPSQFKWTCEHCGKSGKGKGNYSRHHGDKCKKSTIG